jgi:hypothetical protein
MHQATWSLFDEGVEQCLGERPAFIDMRPMVLVYVPVVGQDMVFANQDSRRLTYIGMVNAGDVKAWFAVLLQYMLWMVLKQRQATPPFRIDGCIGRIVGTAYDPWLGGSLLLVWFCTTLNQAR